MKIFITATVITALLVGAKARLNEEARMPESQSADDSEDNTYGRMLQKKRAQAVDCDYDEQVEVDFEFRTDGYPYESTIIVEDPQQFGKRIVEWGPFPWKDFTYKTEKGEHRMCGGQCYFFKVLDSVGDGMDRGGLKIKSQGNTLLNVGFNTGSFSNKFERTICLPKKNPGSTNPGGPTGVSCKGDCKQARNCIKKKECDASWREDDRIIAQCCRRCNNKC